MIDIKKDVIEQRGGMYHIETIEKFRDAGI